jgi:uncharacterized membrane protein (DUF485 family)
MDGNQMVLTALTTGKHAAGLAYTNSGLVDALIADELVAEIRRRRHAFVHPLFLAAFSLFCLTLLAFAYLPDLVGYRVYGAINLAYLLALSQFGITFLVAATYARWARTAIDPLTHQARIRLAAQSVK